MKTLKIVTKKFGDPDNITECEYAFIEISEAYARKLALRGQNFAETRANDSQLYSVTYFDYTAEFFAGWDPEDFEGNVLAAHGDLEFFEREGYMVVGDSFSIPQPESGGFGVRLDFSELVLSGVTEVDFRWKANVKHTDVYVESQDIPLTILAKII